MPDQTELNEHAQKQGELWGARARDWAEVIEPSLKAVYEGCLNNAGVMAGTRYCDAGCGTGGALLGAMRRGARLAGFDPAVNFLKITQQRCGQATLALGSLEAIPFPDASFDAVTAINSLQFCSDAATALAELRRVLRPKGRVVVAVWSRPEESDMRLVSEAVRALFPEPPKNRGAFEWSEPKELDALIEASPLKQLGSRVVDCPWESPDLPTALRGQLATGPTIRAMQILGEEPVTAAISGALERFRTESGAVKMMNRFRLITLASRA